MAAAACLAATAVLAQQCPAGTYPWTDQWGNRICKRFDGGDAAAIEGRLDRCPPGTQPWTDAWGNRVCRSFDGRQDFYDTSRGCPAGTYPWTDDWGNAVCRRF